VINYLTKLFKQGIALCVIATPLCALLYDPSVIFPFITLKAFAFHSLVLLGLALSSTLLLIDNQIRQKLFFIFDNKTFKAYLLLLFFIFISGLFAENSLIALWGTSERADGIYLHIFCLYLTIISVLILKKHHWNLVFYAIIFISLILLYFQMMQDGRGFFRPGSLLNQPTFLASIYLISIGSCLLLAVEKNNNILKMFLFILTFLFIYGIFISGTRASLIATVFALVVVFFNLYKIDKKVFITLFSIAIAAIIIIIIKYYFFKTSDGFYRIIDFSNNYSSIQSRLINLLISLNSINPLNGGFKNFLIGWGWDNYFLAWDYAYIPEIKNYDPAPFDKAHNTYLDILVMLGVLGFFAFCNLIFRIFTSIKRIKFYSLKLAFIFIFTSKFIEYFFTFDSFIGVVLTQIIFANLIWLELESYSS